MSKQKPRIIVDQSGSTIGIGSVKNLNTEQICGSRDTGKTTPPITKESEAPKTSKGVTIRRNYAIGVELNPQAGKQAQIDETARTIGDFVGDLISAIFDI